MAFELPALTYAHDALNPVIDTATMQIHHGKHHGAYVTNINKAVDSAAGLAGKSIEDLIANGCAAVPEGIRTAVRNNGGGHANHAMFWEIMAPNAGGAPSGALGEAIASTFGSFDNFKEKFEAAGMTRFGSGWAWLVLDGSGLSIASTPNQDTPLMEGKCPVFGVDVWEHAYYLHYQNRRADYLKAWWSVANWKAIEARFNAKK
ncbi:MAG: superoxide dismutase [Acidobacteria bacterium]|nr:superoxide dismutase [Acidobacteriota bacterium]